MARKLYKHAFSSGLTTTRPTKTLTANDGSTTELVALPVLPASPFRTIDGRSGIEFSYLADALIQSFDEKGRKLPLDIEHNTEKADDDTRARGWIHALTTAEREPDVGLEPGVLFGWVELTPLGQEELSQKLYGYTSGVALGVWLDEGRVQFTRIKSLALTNNPATEMPMAFCAEDDEDAPDETGYTRENASSGDDPAMLKAILEALGLTAEADEQAALAAVKALNEAAAKAALASRIDTSDVAEGFTGQFVAATRVEAVETKLTALTAELTAAQAEATALKTQLTAAETTVQELRAAQAEVQLTAVLDELTRSRVITPAVRAEALELARLDVAKFQAFAAKLQPVVDNTERSVDAKFAALNLSAADLAKAKAAGISPETFAAERDAARQLLGI